MNRTLSRIIITIFFLNVFPNTSFSQNSGVVTGKITDANTGEALPGANVIIEGTSIGSSTDIDGNFKISNIAAGDITLIVKFLGYETKKTDVNIAANSTINIDIKLQSSSILQEEVIVTVQAKGQRAAINKQLASSTISNMVSAEKIGELPDANAAEAIGRLPGVSLKRGSGEANQIVIRGLSPKYNNVTVEGVKMSSLGGDRSVDLSNLQSELLGGIEVSKSLRADMDADALGGTVNLKLIGAPDERKIDFTVEGSYAAIANNFNNYKLVGAFSDRFFDKKLGVSLKLAHEQKQLPSHQFHGGYTEKEWRQTFDDNGDLIEKTLFTRTEQANLVDVQQERKRSNASLVLDYKNEWWDVKFINLFGRKNDDVIDRNNVYKFIPGGYGTNFNLSINKTNWLTDTRTHTLQNTFDFGNSKINLTLSNSVAKGTMKSEGYSFVELNPPSIDQEWLIYRQPIEAIELLGGPDSLKIEDSYLREFSLGDSKLTDKSYDVKLDYKYSFSLSDNFSGSIKIGGKYHTMNRDSDGEGKYSGFEYGTGVGRKEALKELYPWIELGANQRGVSAVNFVDSNYNPGKFLNGRYKLGWSGDIDLLSEIQEGYYNVDNGAKYSFRGADSYRRDYVATEELTAVYIMTELNLGKRWYLLPGIRYEKNKTTYSAYHIVTNSGVSGIAENPEYKTIDRANEMFFPSLNVKFKISKAATIQGAVYSSTTRPSFNQISPLVIYHPGGSYIESNNPFLQPAKAINYDLGISFMTPKFGLFTIYGFYKKIDNLVFTMTDYPIINNGEIVDAPEEMYDRLVGEEYYDPQYLSNGSKTNLPFNSTEPAYIKGVELSWQTSLWYLPGLLKGLVFDINYSLIDSKTTYPYIGQIKIGENNWGLPIYGPKYETREGPMHDQPASILNMSLGWDYKGFSSRISYRYQAQTVNGLDTRYSIFDSYYDTFSLIDLTLNQKINKYFSVYTNMTNLGNHVDDYFFGEQEGKPALPTNSQFYGTRIQVGVRMRF